MRRSASFAALLLALGASGIAAQGNSSKRAAPIEGRIDVADLPYGAYVGSTFRLAAAVRVTSGPVNEPTVRLAWHSSDLKKAWITDDGIVTFFEPGEVTFTATYGPLSATKAVMVVASPAAKVTLSGEPHADVRVGVPIRLTARVIGNDGRPIDDAQVNYAVVGAGNRHAPSTAIVTSDGVFTASEPGVYTVVAEFGGKSDGVTMLLGMPGVATAPATDDVKDIDIEGGDYDAYAGTTMPLSLRVRREGAKDPVVNPRVHWSSDDTDVAWVGQDGIVVFEGTGRVTITAEHGSKFARRTFIVGRNPAARLVLMTTAREIHPGDTLTAKTEVWARGAQPVRRARVNYGVIARTPGTDSAARILDDGRFVADRAGVYTIVAELGGLADTRTIMVTPRITSANRTGSGRKR